MRFANVEFGAAIAFVLLAGGVGCSSSDDEASIPPVAAATTDGGPSSESPFTPGNPSGGERPGQNPGADGGPAAVDAAHPDANVGNCKPLTFPSGVTLRTKPDSKMTDEYQDIAAPPDYPLPECFIDTNDLDDPYTGAAQTIDVMVGKHFSLKELVGTELSYGALVLLSPTLVAKLDAYREALAESVSLTSGYRSPAHQRAVCQDLCGADSCPGTCAKRSRHSWGDAADHGVTPTKKYSDAGCAAQFNYVYREGNHVHLDLNPAHAICTVDIL
jgi:hypothetical protein